MFFTRSLKRLIIAVAACIPVAIVAQQSNLSDAQYMAIVTKGAPFAVVRNATVIRSTANGNRVLQKGADGFTCGVTAKGPVCADRGALAWMRAMATHTKPPHVVGFAYMLGGDSGTSNTDMNAMAPTATNHWIKTGPQVMLYGPSIKQMGYPMKPSADTRSPYVMWANTPYAHLMIPVTNEHPA